jgi:hypothetical protein
LGAALRAAQTAPISFVERLLKFDSCFMIQGSDELVWWCFILPLSLSV